jgi:hypothetical protein
MTNPFGSPPADPWTASQAPTVTGTAPAQPHAWSDAAAGQWIGQSVPVQPSTNGWSVVALVTGLIGLVPVAVPAGVVGLVQAGRRRQAGRGLAIGGLVAAGVWTLAAVALLAFVLTAPDLRAGSPADVGTAAVGECLDAPADGSGPWAAASCTAPHDGEVYVVDEVDDARWPGEDELAVRADDTCHAEFADYVGRSYMASAHDYLSFSPDARDWAGGDRRIVCVVVPFEDDVLIAPVRGSGD